MQFAQQKAVEKETTTEVTREMSMAMVVKLLRSSFHLVAGFRGFFPKDCLEKVHLEGVSYLGLKKDSGNEQVELYNNWIEKGLRESVRKGYLKSCLLEVYETKNNEAGKLVEVYKFEVKYSDEGADFFISQGATSDKSYPIGSKDSIKEGVRNVLWKLLDLTRDMEPLPENRRMTMRLFYNESAPEGYQAPMFRATTEEERLSLINSSTLIGSEALSTPHHTIDMSVFVNNTDARSNARMEGDGDDGRNLGQGNRRHSHSRSGKNPIHADAGEDSSDDSDHSAEQNETQKSAKQLSKRTVASAPGNAQDVTKKSTGKKKRKIVDKVAVDDDDASSEPESDPDSDYLPEPTVKPRVRAQASRARRGGLRRRGGHLGKANMVRTRPKKSIKKSTTIRETQSAASSPLTNGRNGISEKNVNTRDRK